MKGILYKQRLLPLLLATIGAMPLLAQPGKSGAATITTAATTINSYTNVTADIAVGATSISVANSALTGGAFGSTALAAGDYILIIQMQGASIDATNTTAYGSITSYNNAGLYEFACVSAVPNATSITLAAPTVNAYTATGKVQIVRIPRYTTLTVSSPGSIIAAAWNGTTGGVVAIETTGAIALNVTQSVNVNGLGFRGGALDNNTSTADGTVVTTYRSTSSNDGAEKGESIAGYQTEYDALNGRYGRGAAANGGGGGNGHNAGGGGGSNGNNGVTYTGTGNPSTSTAAWANAWNLEAINFATSTSSGGGRGGYSYGSANQDALTVAPGNNSWGGDQRDNVGGFGGRPLNVAGNRLFLGGGGGAGDANNSAGGAGGNGGGLVFIIAGGNITGGGSITANGSAGANSVGGHNDAPGGGGGGGSVVIYNRSGNVANTISIQANGGVGGNQLITSNESEGPGGGGGGGYIAITSGTPTRTVNGAANGTTSSTAVTEFTPNGATAGASGLSQTYSPASSLFIAVSGTVLNDANGHTDNLINGTGSNLGGTLYVSAVQSATVIATVPVQSNGTFTFTTLPPGTYDVVLHNNAAGQATSTMPANTRRTAEGATTAGDGTVNGIVVSSTTCAPVTGLLYGVNRQPVSTNYTGSGFSLPPGSDLASVPSIAFNGTDGEDGTYANNLNTRTVRLNPAVGGTLYYFNGSIFQAITVATDISNFNNDNVYLDPSASSGPATVSFTYSVRDNGGEFNATPATVTMGFAVLLPATGLQLKASLHPSGKVQLNWSTLTEQQTAYFQVEMSYDGVSFESMGKVAAAGNSNAQRQYSLQQAKPMGSKWYFRVKLIDLDGKVSYSNVAVLQTAASAASIGLAPNPAKNEIWVTGLRDANSLVLRSMSGVQVMQREVTAENMSLNISQLSDGVYLLQVLRNDGSTQVLKLMKR